MRQLASTRRRVGDADLRRYDRAWDGVCAAAAEVGANAWRFRSARDPLLFVEYVEFSGSDPFAEPEFAEAVRALDEFGPADREDMIEAAAKTDGGR